MAWWEAALLGLVQGITEFLPISSSGHLVLGKYLLGLRTEAGDAIIFEVFLHFGTVLSILTVYWSQVVAVVRDTVVSAARPSEVRARYKENENFRTGLFILITLIPTAIVYVLFSKQLAAAFDNPRFVCAMLLVTGLLLLLTLLRKNPNGRLTPLKALVIGVAQAAAMTPGISRSGSTICAALYQNVQPERAANFSFLMLLPVVLGATFIESLRLADHGVTLGWAPIVIGTIVAYGAGIVAIKVVLDFVRRGRLQYFAYYCFAAGTLGLIFI